MSTCIGGCPRKYVCLCRHPWLTKLYDLWERVLVALGRDG